MTLPQPIRRHPNAMTAGVSGVGVGTLIVWALGHWGISMDAEVAAVIAGMVSSVALLIGKAGLRGLARLIWRGSGE